MRKTTTDVQNKRSGGSIYFRHQLDQEENRINFISIWIAKHKITTYQLQQVFFDFQMSNASRKVLQSLIILKKFSVSNFMNLQSQIYSKVQRKIQVQQQMTQDCSLQILSAFDAIENEMRNYQELQHENGSNFQAENYNILQNVLQKYSIGQISKIQALSIKQKLYRLEMASKYFNLQISLTRSKQQVFTQNLVISLQKSIQKMKQEQSILQIMQAKRIIFNNQHLNSLIGYLIKFYEQFKSKTNFFPPKITLMDIYFNQITSQFSVNQQWILLWCLGLIQKPINLMQKIANFQTQPSPHNKKIIQDPLIYLNPLWQREQTQFTITKQKLLNTQRRIECWKKLQKYTEQKYKIPQNQILANKLKSLKQTKRTEWQDIDEFIAVFNILMLIYFSTNMIPFDILQQVIKNNYLNEFQLQNQTFSQVKIFFVCECFTNNKHFWLILFSCLQNEALIKSKIVQNIMKSQKVHKILNFKILRQIFIEPNQQENSDDTLAKTIQKNGQSYIALLKNISCTESVMLASVHNSVRYLIIIFFTKIFEIDMLYYPQIQQKKYQISLQTISKIQEVKQAKKKVGKFRAKSYQKILYYLNNQTQVRQNNRIINGKAKRQLNFAKQIVKQDYSNLIYSDLSKKRKQIFDQLLPFVTTFLYHKKNLKCKELHIAYQFKQKLTPQIRLSQILKFCIEAILLNFSILQILLYKVKNTQIGNLYLDEQGINRLMQKQLNKKQDLKNIFKKLVSLCIQKHDLIEKNKAKYLKQLQDSKCFSIQKNVIQRHFTYQASQSQSCFFGFNIVYKLMKVSLKAVKQDTLSYRPEWEILQAIIRNSYNQQQIRLHNL